MQLDEGSLRRKTTSEQVKFDTEFKKRQTAVHDTDKSSSVFVLVVSCFFLWSFKVPARYWGNAATFAGPSYELKFQLIHEIHCTFVYKQLINISSFWRLKIKISHFLHNLTKRVIINFVVIANGGVQLSLQHHRHCDKTQWLVVETIRATSCTFQSIK